MLEHSTKTAQLFAAIIRQAKAVPGKPTPKRAFALGKVAGEGVLVVGKRKPSAMGTELVKMSKKKGTVTVLATGEVEWSDNEIVLKTMKSASESTIRTAFLEYYKAYKAVPPSRTIRLLQPGQWETVEFDDSDVSENLEDDLADVNLADEGAADESSATPESAAVADEPPAPPPPPSAAYEAKLGQIRPRVQEAIDTQHPDAQKLGTLLQFAIGKAAAANYLAALQGLAATEKLLDTPSTAQSGPPKAAVESASDPSAHFTARLAALLPRVKAAVAAGGPHSEDIKLKASEAGVFARKKDFDHGESLLDEVEAMLEGSMSVADPPPQPAVQPGVGSAAEGRVGLVQFAKLRLQWQAAKSSVQGELAQLRTAVESDLPGDPLLAKLSRLSEVLAAFNEGLSEALDDLANSDTPAKRRAAAEAAQAASEHYMDHILDDPLIDHVETNPFVEVRISAHLLPPLSAVNAALGSIAQAA